MARIDKFVKGIPKTSEKLQKHQKCNEQNLQKSERICQRSFCKISTSWYLQVDKLALHKLEIQDILFQNLNCLRVSSTDKLLHVKLLAVIFQRKKTVFFSDTNLSPLNYMI